MRAAVPTFGTLCLTTGLAYQQAGVALAAGTAVVTLIAIAFFKGVLDKAWTRVNPDFEQLKDNYTFRRVSVYCALAAPVVAHALRFFTPLVVPTAVTALGIVGLLGALMVAAQLRRDTSLHKKEDPKTDPEVADPKGILMKYQQSLRNKIDNLKTSPADPVALDKAGPAWYVESDTIVGKKNLFNEMNSKVDQADKVWLTNMSIPKPKILIDELNALEQAGQLFVMSGEVKRVIGHTADSPIANLVSTLQDVLRWLNVNDLKLISIVESLIQYLLPSFSNKDLLHFLKSQIPFEGNVPSIETGSITISQKLMQSGEGDPPEENLHLVKEHPVVINSQGQNIIVGTIVIHHYIPMNDLKGRFIEARLGTFFEFKLPVSES
jgi:hypothetical protein